MKKLAFLSLLCLLMASCTVDRDGIRDPVAEAQANAANSKTRINAENANLDLAIREKNAETELAAKRAIIENDRLRAEAEAQGIAAIAEARAMAEQSSIKEKGKADAKSIESQGEAKSQFWNAVGIGSRIAIIALGIGLAVSIVIGMTGRTVAYTYNSIQKSKYVLIGAEPRTLLPPPIVITMDGYLLDTRTGERARLRDAAGVNRLRLAATTQTTNLALMGRTAEEIAKTAKGKDGAASAEVGGMLPAIAQSVPLLEVIDA